MHQVCLSMHRALDPNMRAKLPGFALRDVVGDDCLHAARGVHGIDYVTDVLVHAFDRARSRYSRRSGGASSAPPLTLLNTFQGSQALPPPLHPANAAISKRPARCYGFVRAADYRIRQGQSSTYRALQPIQWSSAWCPLVGESPGVAATRLPGPRC